MENLTLMQELKPQLEAEGFATFYKETTPERGVDQLILPLAKEDGTALNLEINTIPDTQNIYPDTEFIQCFIAIPLEVKEAKFSETIALLNKINMELPLGSFSLHEAGVIFYKYSLVISRDDRMALFSRLINSIDISNHLFQNYETFLIEFISS